MNTQEWLSTIDFFVRGGTKRGVFSGGEHLVREDAVILLEHARNVGLEVILSTNGILLTSRVLPLIDKVGIPIDGSTTNVNRLIRNGNANQYRAALHAIDMVRTTEPGIKITARTVATTLNQNDLPNIAQLLIDHGVGRWKIYELLPTQGLRDINKRINWDTLRVKSLVLEKLVAELQTSFQNLEIIPVYLLDFILKRYLIVKPNGEVEDSLLGGFGNTRTVAPDVMAQRLSLINQPHLGWELI